MQSPQHTAEALEFGAHASELATPGASVAAQRGNTSVLSHTPGGPPSPGQGSPTRHRSQEGSSLPLDAFGGRTGSRAMNSLGLETAGSGAAVAPAAAAAEPMSKPRLRVQGTDIILEDAASPKAAVAAQAGASGSHQLAAATAAPNQQAATATHGVQQQRPQQSQQQAGGGQQHPFIPAAAAAAAARTSQSHEHELQLRLASRTVTATSNQAMASGRLPTLPPGGMSHAEGDDR